MGRAPIKKRTANDEQYEQRVAEGMAEIEAEGGGGTWRVRRMLGRGGDFPDFNQYGANGKGGVEVKAKKVPAKKK